MGTSYDISDVDDNSFDTIKWYNEASDMALKIGVTPSIPCVSGQQTQRNNVTATSPEEYYRCAVTMPFVDHLLQELNTR